jgi:hypothetical protein
VITLFRLNAQASFGDYLYIQRIEFVVVNVFILLSSYVLDRLLQTVPLIALRLYLYLFRVLD